MSDILRVIARLSRVRVSSQFTKTNFSSKHVWITASGTFFLDSFIALQLIQPTSIFRTGLMILFIRYFRDK